MLKKNGKVTNTRFILKQNKVHKHKIHTKTRITNTYKYKQNTIHQQISNNRL